MSGVIIQFLRLEVTNFHPAVHWGLLIVWGLLLAAAFSSLRQLDIFFGAKIIWFLLILFIPILGLAIYALWCLIRADWTFLKPLFQSRSQAIKAIIDPGEVRKVK